MLTLSSQPNFHHQTEHLIRLPRIWGLLLFAHVALSMTWTAATVLCCCHLHKGQAGSATCEYHHFLFAPPYDQRSLWQQLSASIRMTLVAIAPFRLTGNWAKWLWERMSCSDDSWLCREVLENPTWCNRNPLCLYLAGTYGYIKYLNTESCFSTSSSAYKVLLIVEC